MSEPITNAADAVRALGALPVPVGPEPQPLSGPICSQAEARAAGLDIAPSVEELDAMASTIVAAGDPLSAEVSLAQAVPLLGAAVTGLRARVAELEVERHVTNEALDDVVRELWTSYADRARRETHPGRRQAWRMLAQCEESERVANALLTPEAARSADKLMRLMAPTQAPREDAPPLRGRALLDALMVERAEQAHNQRLGIEDPHDSPLHHSYRVGRDLPETGGDQC